MIYRNTHCSTHRPPPTHPHAPLPPSYRYLVILSARRGISSGISETEEQENVLQIRREKIKDKKKKRKRDLVTRCSSCGILCKITIAFGQLSSNGDGWAAGTGGGCWARCDEICSSTHPPTPFLLPLSTPHPPPSFPLPLLPPPPLLLHHLSLSPTSPRSQTKTQLVYFPDR